MCDNLQRVKPGDLIQADNFNAILDCLDELNARVTILEEGLPPNTSVTLKPFLGSARIGDSITVEGTNFEYPPRFNTVTLGEQPITQFNPGSDETHLVFNVPDISNVPRDAPFTVSNRNGTASMVIPVLPASEMPEGELHITPQPIGEVTIEIGNSYTIPFVLNSETTIAETYELEIDYTNPSGASITAWENNSSIRNAVGGTISSVTISPGSPVTVYVHFVVPEGAVRIDMGLHASSTNNPEEPEMNPTSSPLTIEIGQEQEVSDPRVTFGSLLVDPDDHLVEGAIESDVGGTTLLQISADFEEGGDYSYATRLIPETSPPWNVTILSPPDHQSFESPGTSEDIIVNLLLNSSDPEQSRQLEIRVTRDANGESFESWFRIPLRST